MGLAHSQQTKQPQRTQKVPPLDLDRLQEEKNRLPEAKEKSSKTGEILCFSNCCGWTGDELESLRNTLGNHFACSTWS